MGVDDCIKNFLPIRYTFITITVILDGTLIQGSKKYQDGLPKILPFTWMYMMVPDGFMILEICATLVHGCTTTGYSQLTVGKIYSCITSLLALPVK